MSKFIDWIRYGLLGLSVQRFPDGSVIHPTNKETLTYFAPDGRKVHAEEDPDAVYLGANYWSVDYTREGFYPHDRRISDTQRSEIIEMFRQYVADHGMTQRVEILPEAGDPARHDFYLASTEGYDLHEPRSCRFADRLKTETGRDVLVVDISPPLIGQKYGLGGVDIERVALIARHQGVSLFPIESFPVDVHIARLGGPSDTEQNSNPAEALEFMAWGEISRWHTSFEHAREKGQPTSHHI